MKLIIAGSRTITDGGIVEEAVREFIEKHSQSLELFGVLEYHEIFEEIVSGKARGVDRVGERLAKKWGIPVKPMPADWDRYGKIAGHIRNWQMSKYGTGLVAVWDGKSTGTANMIAWAAVNNLPLHVKQIKV